MWPSPVEAGVGTMKPSQKPSHLNQKPSQLSLCPIAIASLAFLLNWLVFVDSAPLTALATSFDMPFDLDGIPQSGHQQGALVPIFPQDQAVLNFETPTYAVALTQRGEDRYLSIQDKRNNTSIINNAAVQVIWQGGEPVEYRHIPTDTRLPKVHIRQLSGRDVEFKIDHSGQSLTELGR